MCDVRPLSQSVNLSGCMDLTTENLIKLVKTCPSINDLSVAHIRAVNDDFVVAMGEELWLERLDIAHCTAVSAGT